jgi:hypothetical protein
MSHELDALNKRLDHIEGLLERLASGQKQDAKWRSIFKTQMNALIRAQFVGPELAATDALQAKRFRLRSQNEEDGIVLALLHASGVSTRRFVEIGCGGNGGNSGLLAYELGWSGLMLDSSGAAVRTARDVFAGKSRVRIERETVTTENINDVLTRFGFAGEVDFLSIDVDSVDYWLLDALTVTNARVLSMEYNALFGPSRAVTIPNAPRPQGAKGYHGASLAALEMCARRKGYRLVLCEDAGINAFFVREGLAPGIPTIPVADAWRPRSRRYDVTGETPAAERDIYKMIEEKGLALVDV